MHVLAPNTINILIAKIVVFVRCVRLLDLLVPHDLLVVIPRHHLVAIPRSLFLPHFSEALTAGFGCVFIATSTTATIILLVLLLVVAWSPFDGILLSTPLASLADVILRSTIVEPASLSQIDSCQRQAENDTRY